MVELTLDQLQNPSDINKKQELQREEEGEELESPQQEDQPLSLNELQTPSSYQAQPEKDPEEESFLSLISRNLLANTRRVVEKVAGTPGDLEKLSRAYLASAPSSGGLIGNAIADWIGKEDWEKAFSGTQHLPTSEKVKKDLDSLLGESEPRNKTEKGIQEFSEDVGGVLGGIATMGTTFDPRNILAIPALANATKEVVRWAGLGEDKANTAKMAVWLPLSLANNVNGSAHASRMMNEGRQGIPQNLQSNVARLERALTDLEGSPMMLGSDPRSALARQQIASIRNDLANGQTSVRALMNAYDGINATKRSRGLFDLGRTDRNFARQRIDEVGRAVRNEIREAGHSYPEAIQSWNNGLGAWATVHQSRTLTNWVESIAKGPYAKIIQGPAAALFGVGAYGASKIPLVAGTTAAATAATYKTGQVLYRMWSNENLSRYYWGAISAAQSENLPVFINNYSKLNKEIEKSQPVKKGPQRNKHNK